MQQDSFQRKPSEIKRLKIKELKIEKRKRKPHANKKPKKAINMEITRLVHSSEEKRNKILKLQLQ